MLHESCKDFPISWHVIKLLLITLYITQSASAGCRTQKAEIMESSLHIAYSILDSIDFEWKRSLRDSVPQSSNLLLKRFIPIKSNFLERLSDNK